MKKLKLWQKAGLVATVVGGLALSGCAINKNAKGLENKIPSISMNATESKDTHKEDLGHIIMYCLLKGERDKAEPMKYMEIRNKTDKGMRKVYFEVYYSVSEKGISANKIRFVESEYIPSKISADTPHNDLITQDFTPYIGKDMVLIKQKMIADGGGYGTLDGNADIMMERTATETADKVVLNIDESTIEDKNKVEKTYKGYVKEIINITGKEEIKEEKPKAMYEVPL